MFSAPPPPRHDALVDSVSPNVLLHDLYVDVCCRQGFLDINPTCVVHKKLTKHHVTNGIGARESVTYILFFAAAQL